MKDYKDVKVEIVLRGNEVDVLDHLMLSVISAKNMSKEGYNEASSCLHNIRTQITDVLEKEVNHEKNHKEY